MSDSSLVDKHPGELLMWVLIISEVLVFGAGLIAFGGCTPCRPGRSCQGVIAPLPHRSGAQHGGAGHLRYLAAQALHWHQIARRGAACLALIAVAAPGAVPLSQRDRKQIDDQCLKIDVDQA